MIRELHRADPDFELEDWIRKIRFGNNTDRKLLVDTLVAAGYQSETPD